MGTAQCRTCRQFYGDGDWPRTEDGDEYCRMCAQGGDILLCDKCPNAFCKKCLGRNLGGRALREITKSEEWSCLLCDPTPIQNLQAIYMKLYKSQDEIKEKRAKDREEARKNKKPAKKEAVSKKEKDALVKSPKNFLGTHLYIRIYETQISYKMGGKINFLTSLLFDRKISLEMLKKESYDQKVGRSQNDFRD